MINLLWSTCKISKKRKRNEAVWLPTFAGCQHSILKKGSRLSSLVAKELPPINTLKAVKKRDVLQLLQAMGQNEVMQVMDFYRSVCKESENNADESDNNEGIMVRNEDNW